MKKIIIEKKKLYFNENTTENNSGLKDVRKTLKYLGMPLKGRSQ